MAAPAQPERRATSRRRHPRGRLGRRRLRHPLVCRDPELIDGALAIGGSRVYANNAVFVFSDLNTWGWIVLVLGLALIAAARGVLQGREFWRWFGVSAASLNALAQLLFAQSYPLWSVAMFGLDVIVVCALSVHAGRKLTTR